MYSTDSAIHPYSTGIARYKTREKKVDREQAQTITTVMAAAALFVGLVAYAATNHLTTTGWFGVTVGGVVSMIALGIVLLPHDLNWIARGGAFVIALAVGLVFAGGVFGPLTGKSPEQIAQEAHRAETIAARSHYTDGVIIQTVPKEDASNNAPFCRAIDSKTFTLRSELPTGLSLESRGNTCVITLDWSSNSVLAFPTRNGVNALNEFQTGHSKRAENTGKILIYTVPLDPNLEVNVFLYNTSMADKAVPLPEWANTEQGCYGCHTAIATHI